MNIKTRFAPSPTGFIHLGNVRTALFSWLHATKNNGEFLIRIDDTDYTRSSPMYTNNIIYILNWLNIKSKKYVIFQSKRYKRYKNIIETLIKTNYAYKCYCTKERLNQLKNDQVMNKKNIKYDKFCKTNQSQKGDFVIRINTECTEKIIFYDCIKGYIDTSNLEIDDFIIAKNNFHPTYNLASVIDDIDFEITDIIRGDDHISNTPKQILIFNALHAQVPKLAHLPMILDENKKPLSKRDKESRIDYYKCHGFLPDALLNYIVRLGWAHKNKEIFSVEDMINLFDIKDVSSSPSMMNKSKLIWLNKHYIKSYSNEKLIIHLLEIEKKFELNYMLGPKLSILIDVNKHKINTLEDIIIQNTFLYTEKINIDKNLVNLFFSNEIITILKQLYSKIKALKIKWTIENIKQIISNIITEHNISLNKLATPLRILITGNNNPNSIYDIIFLTGKILLLKKIRNIIKQYENGAIAQNG